jgi:spore germination protein KC
VRIKNIVLVVAVICYTLLLTGCWDYREIDKMGIVAGIAVDQGKDGKGYHLTFDLVDISSSSGGGATAESRYLETDGDTFFDAVRNAVSKNDKKLYFGDCEIVIVSNEIAKKGVSPIIDFINRDAEPRLTIDLLVSQEKTAKQVIMKKSVLNKITSYQIDQSVTTNMDYLSKAPYIQIYQVNDLLAGNGISLVLPTLVENVNDDEKVVSLNGTAVFKKDKLIGYLDRCESKYLIMIGDNVEGGVFLSEEETNSPNIAFEIDMCKTKLKPIIKNSKPSVDISVYMEVALDDLETKADYESPEGIAKLEKDADKILEYRIKELIKKVQTNFDSDIFGFGQLFYQDKPEYWDTVKAKWDTLFKTLDVNVSANINIVDTSLTRSKPKVGE